MTQNRSTSPEVPQTDHSPKPDPALKRLDPLVGTWDLTGRTLGSPEDNISGRVIIEWLPGGFFLQQRGEMDFMGFKAQSLEVIGYDPASNTFPSTVYSSMDGAPAPYHWDVQGNIVTHWTDGHKYTGTFSADGNTLAGGWRPDEGTEETAENRYDAVMTRVR
ncbi:MAG: DUF1579 family protein [Caldilineaceae bacterium]|nr:DUF1579 family protein [Caldilineaceae bacterium]